MYGVDVKEEGGGAYRPLDVKNIFFNKNVDSP